MSVAEPAIPSVPTHREALLDVGDLVTRFVTATGEVTPVDHVSLSLNRGRVLGIVGESGSGKTVLSRSIMGLLPTRSVSMTGSVLFKGEELVGRSRQDLSRLWGDEIAMVFQDPMTALNPVRTVGDQVAEAVTQHRSMTRRSARASVHDLLFDVGIPDPKRRALQYPHQLSGGMRQRVVIAMALAGRPSLLLADEPTTALDVTVQSQILDLLAQQRRLYSTAMILVTHDVAVAVKECDEIAVMYSGRIVEQAPASTLLAERVMPYTDALIRSIPTLDDVPHSRLDAIVGRPPGLADAPAGCRFHPRCCFAQDRCRIEEPPLAELSADHRFRCWFPLSANRGMALVEPSAAPSPLEDGSADTSGGVVRSAGAEGQPVEGRPAGEVNR
ncbi:MAG: ABC transporter ATP-binding protein [Actinobacteria bacterium]|nr:ABC transporter ATP-binding protein [Actinomycetota bacterium]MCB9389208.1 ABC transporter ATP-binding protein [Acidimicrobiia bacterium]